MNGNELIMKPSTVLFYLATPSKSLVSEQIWLRPPYLTSQKFHPHKITLKHAAELEPNISSVSLTKDEKPKYYRINPSDTIPPQVQYQYYLTSNYANNFGITSFYVSFVPRNNIKFHQHTFKTISEYDAQY